MRNHQINLLIKIKTTNEWGFGYLGGDSDTNAAIVGGVVGAYVGIDNIDQEKVRKLLECTLSPQTNYNQDRPRFI